MPPVMDDAVKTATRKYGATDQKLPPIGSRIPFTGAPAFQEWDEVTGNIQREIRGNLNYFEQGNMTSLLTGTLRETIQTDYILMVLGNMTSTVVGKTNTSNLGAHLQLNGSTRTENFTGIVTRNYQGNLVEHHPESWIQVFKDVFHMYIFRITFYAVMKLDIATTALSVNGLKFDVNLFKGDINVNKVDAGALELKLKAIQAKVLAAASKMLATGLLIALLYLGTPFKPNALPAPTPITPFD